MASIGERAPTFVAKAIGCNGFTEIKSCDFEGKFLVLLFYSADLMNITCEDELCAFSERIEEFLCLDCDLLACSTDSVFTHRAWLNPNNDEYMGCRLNFPLMADKTGQIARAFGCLKEDENIAFRGLYIIDAKWRVQHISVYNMQVDRSVDEVLRLVTEIKRVQERKSVCNAPAKPAKKCKRKCGAQQTKQQKRGQEEDDDDDQDDEMEMEDEGECE